MGRKDDTKQVCEAQETDMEENMEHVHNNIINEEVGFHGDYNVGDKRAEEFKIYKA